MTHKLGALFVALVFVAATACTMPVVVPGLTPGEIYIFRVGAFMQGDCPPELEASIQMTYAVGQTVQFKAHRIGPHAVTAWAPLPEQNAVALVAEHVNNRGTVFKTGLGLLADGTAVLTQQITSGDFTCYAMFSGLWR